MQRRESRIYYAFSVQMHTAAAVAVAASAGALIGAASVSLGIRPSDRGYWAVLGASALLLLLRDLEIVRFPLPELRRQTRGAWYREFGPKSAAMLWGLDLGSGLTTFISFSGYWLIVLAGALGGSIGYSVLMLVAYAIGRSAVVWLPAVLTIRRGAELPTLLHRIAGDTAEFRRWHQMGLGVIALVAVVRLVW